LRFLDLTPKTLRQSAHPGSHDDHCTWLQNSGLSSATEAAFSAELVTAVSTEIGMGFVPISIFLARDEQ
jgi:hypothetical protein